MQGLPESDATLDYCAQELFYAVVWLISKAMIAAYLVFCAASLVLPSLPPLQLVS